MPELLRLLAPPPSPTALCFGLEGTPLVYVLEAAGTAGGFIHLAGAVLNQGSPDNQALAVSGTTPLLGSRPRGAPMAPREADRRPADQPT